MRANAIEAAEQCGVLNVADISEPTTLARAIAARKPDRFLVFCDEEAEVNNPIEALADARPSPTAMLPLTMSGPNELQSIAVLVGPEGGFAEDERAALMKLPNTVRLSLGPRILRADTAAVAALALVQAMLGDWR
jgi:16S rRNA (uracil1498-N3)-methyltransferase